MQIFLASTKRQTTGTVTLTVKPGVALFLGNNGSRLYAANFPWIINQVLLSDRQKNQLFKHEGSILQLSLHKLIVKILILPTNESLMYS